LVVSKKRVLYRRVCLFTLLLAVGFICRILAAELFLGGLNREYEGDEGAYIGLALSLAEGRGYVDQQGNATSYRVPGLPLLVTAIVSIIGSNVTAIRLFMCFIGSLLILACYSLGHSASNSQAIGWVAAAVAVFFPTWIVASGFIHTEVVAAILNALVVWSLVKGYREQKLSWFVISGLLWGLATLTRPVALSYGPGIALWLLMVMPNWKKRFVTISVVMIAMACVLAPWFFRNGQVQGRLILTSTQAGVELFKANNPEATGILAIDHDWFDKTLTRRYPEERYPNEAVRSEMFRADAVKFILNNPSRFAELGTIRFGQLWKVYSPRVSFTYSLALIATFGVALPFFLIQVIRRGWKRGPEMLFLLIILCHTAAHIVFTANIRYRIPVEPLVIVLAIQGLCWSVASLASLKETHRVAI
jgi:4-amino-4-deoxy-L-arabinose transferase-like glycosyltransferase